ncbi:uncharacterized protein At4g15970-like isoform X2 [Wolffia australiana]
MNDSPNRGSGVLELRSVLEKAAMVDNTVILTTLNEAWAAPGSVFDLFLESFRIGEHTSGLLKHLVIIALDEKAYERCKFKHVNCYALKTEGVDFSAEKRFMTADYLKMVWRRIDFLRIVLEIGYNFIFTDADVMWFRDPVPFLATHDSDFQIACDLFNGDPDDMSNRVNGGFKFVRSNERTKLFYKFWYESRDSYPGLHDQDVLNFIKVDQYLRDVGLTFKLLPTVKFGGICQPSRDFDQVCTMHANCCVGLVDKLNDLRVIIEDWRMYRGLPVSLKNTHQSKWRIPQKCRIPTIITRTPDISN